MIRRIVAVCDVVVGILGLVMLGMGLGIIILRYLLPEVGARLTIEVVVYTFVWAMFIAGASAAGRGTHVRADLVIRLLKPHTLRILEGVAALLTAAFLAVLGWFGWSAVAFALRIDERSFTALQFPMWVYYLALPVGCALMAFVFAATAVNTWRGRDAVHESSDSGV